MNDTFEVNRVEGDIIVDYLIVAVETGPCAARGI
jgi:hypothetical protein